MKAFQCVLAAVILLYVCTIASAHESSDAMVEAITKRLKADYGDTEQKKDRPASSGNENSIRDAKNLSIETKKAIRADAIQADRRAREQAEKLFPHNNDPITILRAGQVFRLTEKT
jgi:hypothetical protein